MLWLILAIVSCEVILLFIARIKNWLVPAIVAHMALILVAGGKMISFSGWETNVGNFFFGTVMVGQALLIYDQGLVAAQKVISQVFFVMTLIITMVALVVRFPLIGGNETYSIALSTIGGWNLSVIAGSFLGYWLSSQVLIVLLGERRTWLSYVLAVVTAQAVDSVVFFIIVFGANPEVLTIMITGWAVKSIFTLITIPFFVRSPIAKARLIL